MQRLSWMNSQGSHVCDVAILYPLTDLWLSNPSIPPDAEFYTGIQRLLLENHLDYDVVDPTSLARASTDAQGLGLGDEHYRILILPSLKASRQRGPEKHNPLCPSRRHPDRGGWITDCLGKHLNGRSTYPESDDGYLRL